MPDLHDVAGTMLAKALTSSAGRGAE